MYYLIAGFCLGMSGYGLYAYFRNNFKKNTLSTDINDQSQLGEDSDSDPEHLSELDSLLSKRAKSDSEGSSDYVYLSSTSTRSVSPEWLKRKTVPIADSSSDSECDLDIEESRLSSPSNRLKNE